MIEFYDLEDFPELAMIPGKSPSVGQHYRRDENEFERARDALRAIPADGYDVYREIGMALQDAFGDAGFDLYLEWGKRSIKFDDKEIRAKWRSFTPGGGITIATLFAHARDHGWRGQQTGAVHDERGGGAEKEGETKPDMSIVRRNRIAAPTFPLEVFGPAAEWVKTTAESKSAPVDYVALGLLVVTAGMIGPKRRVSPWEGWDEPSILWGALVGDPSSHKSPPLIRCEKLSAQLKPRSIQIGKPVRPHMKRKSRPRMRDGINGSSA